MHFARLFNFQTFRLPDILTYYLLRMKTRLLILILSVICLFRIPAQAQTFGSGDAPSLVLRGYIKEMPALQFDNNFSDPGFINLIHNRLNFRWNIADGWHVAVEGRNRLFYNKMFSDYPFYRDILGQDPGLMDLSWVWMGEGSWIGHSNLDRMYLDWRKGNWHIRAGRQRINWGVNLVSNPNDLFNTYSFFDFDYPERPGADAIRVQYHTGFASRLEVAYSPAENARESTAAFLWSSNYSGYDVQVLAGVYRNRSALGLGWAGNIGGAGFKGEATWFYDLENTIGVDRGNVVAATGFDYMFGNGTFAVLEFLYNGGYSRSSDGILLITQPLRPDNIMFSEYAATMSLSHPFSSLLLGGISAMALPDIDAVFIMPNIRYSLMTNLDMEMVAQIFAGGKNSVFDQAGSAWFLSLQYSF